MLSYQHAYHAGNPADLHKHIVLAELLALLTRKARPITYMETHAGRGLYDLTAPEAVKTGEAAEGIAKLSLPDGPYASTLASVRASHGADAYPGSPLIARTLLRETDQLHLMELHSQEFAALKGALAAPNVAIHNRDGREGVLAISPPKPRKGLVLVDPSYEVKTEYADTAAFAMKLVAKWPEASILIWYPILRAGRHVELIEGLKLKFHQDEVQFQLKDGKGMRGSGLILINAPFGGEAAFEAAHRQGAPILRAIETTARFDRGR